MLFPLVKVDGTQVLVGLLAGQQGLGNDEDGMADGHQGAFLASSGRQPFVLSRQRRLRRFRRDVGNFDEDLPQPAIAFEGIDAAEHLATQVDWEALLATALRQSRERQGIRA